MLERMLEEIKDALKETYLHVVNYDVSDLHYDGDKVACVASAFRNMADEKIEDIIRSHMKDESELKRMCKEPYRTEEVGEEEISQNVVLNIRNYFKEHLPNYEVVKVRKKSWHKDDSYLYMVAAKKNDGTYTVWTSWNEITQALNYGHYDIKDLQTCDLIMDEFYNGGD